MDGELLCLKWRDHSTTLFHMLSSVRKKEVYCDATIACDGRFYPVHKFVLSTCSEYFEQMFEVGEQKSLMIVLTDIGCEELETLLDYMYFGEVNVLQSDLARFMRAAERLRIKGLAEPSEPIHGAEYGAKRDGVQDETDWDSNCQRWSNDSIRSPEAVDMNNSSMQHKSLLETAGHKKKVFEHTKAKNIPEAFVTARNMSSSFGLKESHSNEATTASGLSTSFGLSPNSDQQQVLPASRRPQIKVEGCKVKDEPDDWHHTEMSESSSIFSSAEPVMSYVSHATSLPMNSPNFPASDDHESTHGHSLSSSLDCPTQPLPGPSTLPLRKTGRPTSDIWNHYRTEKNNGKNYVICIYCTTQKYGYPNATKMKIHTVKCKKCPETVRKQYKKELALMVAKTEANKLHYMKPLSPGLESAGYS